MTARYYKGREVLKEYKQGRLVYEKSTSIPDYLCFTALEAGTFTLTIPAAVTPTYLSYVEWSKDGRTWNHTDNTSETVTIDVQVAQGDKVYWRGSGNRCTADTTVATSALNVSSDARFDASGHLLSILKGDDYENVSGVQRYTFCNLFYQNTALVHAHDLVLPPVGLTGVFFQLFRGCSSLVSPPASIPLTTIPAWGCRGMYYDCSSLITPTDLIATTYGNTACTFMYRGCASLTRIATLPTVTSLVDSAQFQQMYYGCTSLTRAELPTVTAPMTTQLFAAMFYRCTNLSYIKCMYTDISTNLAFNDWVYGVSSTGTFIQAEGVEWPRGASGIPTGWLAYDEGEEIPNDYAACDYIHITKGSGMVADVLADKSTYGCELEYNFTQNELDAAANNSTYIPLMYYQKAVTTDPDFPKQINGQLYLRYNADWLGWQRNAGIYTRPATGEKTTNSSALIIKRPTVTGWHYIRCAATTTDDNFICMFDDEISQTGKNYYQLMNENPTDEPAEIYISCRNSSTTYPIDNGGDMKYFKIIHPDGETIVADYVPCARKSDNVAGFWDKVGLVFKSSFGTPFAAGYNQT